MEDDPSTADFSYPVRKVVGGLKVRIEQMNISRQEELYALFNEAARAEDGYSKTEITKEKIYSLFKDNDALMVYNDESDEMIFAGISMPSSLCRSAKPLCCGAFSLTKKSYRNKGILGVVNKMWMHRMHNGHMKYIGVLMRTALGNKVAVIDKISGFEFTGTIPDSLLLEDIGPMDNLIIYRETMSQSLNPKIYKKLLAEHDKPLPPLRTDRPYPERYHRGHQYPERVIRNKAGTFLIRSAHEEELWEIEKLFRSLAEAGEGYGIDEFDQNGCYCRNLLYESDMFVLRGQTGGIVGAALFGPSGLSRSKGTAGACYIAIPTNHRNCGIGKHVLEYIIELASKQNYSVLLLDILAIEMSAMFKIAINAGFTVSGTLPKCAFVKHHGLVDSILLFKRLRQAKSWKSAL